jgi:hypothetical protein
MTTIASRIFDLYKRHKGLCPGRNPAMFINELANNRFDKYGHLLMKTLAKTLAVPPGIHNEGAFGRDGKRHILVTECAGKPYLLSIDSEVIDAEKLLASPYEHAYISYIVEEYEGHPSTITMQDLLTPDIISESVVIGRDTVQPYALERITPSEYGHRVVDNKVPYHIIALGSFERDTFLVLHHPESVDYQLLFVPDEFSASTEWTLAKVRPWEYELWFRVGKCLCLPSIRRKDARR